MTSVRTRRRVVAFVGAVVALLVGCEMSVLNAGSLALLVAAGCGGCAALATAILIRPAGVS